MYYPELKIDEKYIGVFIYMNRKYWRELKRITKTLKEKFAHFEMVVDERNDEGSAKRETVFMISDTQDWKKFYEEALDLFQTEMVKPKLSGEYISNCLIFPLPFAYFEGAYQWLLDSNRLKAGLGVEKRGVFWQ